MNAMTSNSGALRWLLLLGTGLLAITAIPGGVLLLLGLYTPPPQMLGGSVFSSFLVPGLALALLVGGSALLALILLIRRRPLASYCAALSGLVVMTFEFVEVVTIGSPPGPSRTMQGIYFGLGIALAIGALAKLYSDR